MLYHSLAIPFVAALVYFVLDQIPMGSPGDKTGPSLWRTGGSVWQGPPLSSQNGPLHSIVVPVTVGYMLTSLGGMTFAYGGRSWIAHGVYLVGLSLVFYAGVLLATALWPSRRWATDSARNISHPRHTNWKVTSMDSSAQARSERPKIRRRPVNTGSSMRWIANSAPW